MIAALRRAYGAGYRAGLAGQLPTVNPFKLWLKALIWENGWYQGACQGLLYAAVEPSSPCENIRLGAIHADA